MNLHLAMGNGVSYKVLPEYGKRRLMAYADTLKILAGSFQGETLIEEKDKEGLGLGDEDKKTVQGMKLYMYKLWQEQNRILVDQLSETASALLDLAKETYVTNTSLERYKKRMEKGLKDNGIGVLELYVVEVEGQLEIGMEVYAKNKELYNVEDLCDFLSELCHRRLKQASDNVAYMHKEPVYLAFEEEVNYEIVEGVARSKKDGEEATGDSFLMKEYGKGMYLAALSDGCGSGILAASDSERAMDLLESFLDAGFPVDKAALLINRFMYLRGRRERTITIDSIEIDRYQGTCRFIKAGACSSYIKRGEKVYEIGSGSLPMGMFADVQFDEFAYDLMDGDYVILMTDGVMDAFQSKEDLSKLKEYIAGLDYENPKQMASMILNVAITNANGRMKDDMTVLVLSVLGNS